MILGGLQKTSLIDYPGRVSCVLFTQGCNFRCPYCHNPSLVMPADPEKRTDIRVDEVLAFLDHRRGLLDGVVISGGEPTLHEDLPDLCRTIRQMGYAIKLDTNGSRPEMLARLIEKDLVDYVAMDIKTLPWYYGRYIKKGLDPQLIGAGIEQIMQSGKPYEFRTTCARPMVDAHVMDGIGPIIENARLYILQPFVAGDILDPDFFSEDGRGPWKTDHLNRFQTVAAKWVQTCEVRR